MVKDCKIYVRTKASRHRPYREFQTLSVLERAQSSVTIDFIVKLLKSKDIVNNTNYNNIFIIIDRFIKYNKFTPINESHSTEDLADIVVQKIIGNHRLSNEFVIDRGTTFASRFFIAFIIKLGVNNKLFITFYFQTDRQIKRFNQTIE